MAEVVRAIQHRRSDLTAGSMVAVEPRLAYVNILAHESIWIDSAMIPTGAVGDLVPLFDGNALITANASHYFSPAGAALSASSEGAVVQKRVRVALHRGAQQPVAYWAPVTEGDDLRQLIHQNFSLESGALYRPVIEFETSEGEMMVLADHLWRVDYLSGVVRAAESFEITHETLFISAYYYCGRVGLDRSITNPTSDNISEGVVNRYFTQELFTTYLNESAPLSVAFDLSQHTTDDIAEGAINKYATRETMNALLASRTLDDIAPSSTHRAVSETSMRNLGLSVGNVPELHLTPLQQPPVDKNSKLYVEQSNGENTLFFGSMPLTGAAITPEVAVAGSPTEPSLGEFDGAFRGASRGVHTGDVIGNVTGFVSDISNHRIIDAKLLGNGEGHWVGTVNADVVGKFEGAAKIVTGSIDNASHLTIGTFDASASLHVRSNDKHLQLTEGISGASALVECAADGSLHLSCSAMVTDSVLCDAVTCTRTLQATDVNAEFINCVGIANSYYGIFDAGRIEGVSDLSSENVATGGLLADEVTTAQLSCSVATIETLTSLSAQLAVLSAASVDFDAARVTELSVSTFHVGNLAFDAAAFLDNPNLVFNQLSVATSIVTPTISVASLRVESDSFIRNMSTDLTNADLLRVRQVEFIDGAAPLSMLELSASVATIDSLQTDATSCTTLSAQTLVADASSHLSLAATVLSATTLHADASGVAELSVANAYCDVLSVTDMTADATTLLSCSVELLDAKHCSASTIFGTSVGVTFCSIEAGEANSLSVAALSCGTFFSAVAYANALNITDTIVAQKTNTAILSAGNAGVDVLEVASLSVASAIMDGVSVSVMQGEQFETAECVVGVLSAATALLDECSVGTGYLETARVTTLSCADAVVDLGSFQSLAAKSLSASAAVTGTLSTQNLFLGGTLDLPSLSVVNASISVAAVSQLTAGMFTSETLTTTRAVIDTLEVNNIVGFNLSLGSGGGGLSEDVLADVFLSVGVLIEESINSQEVITDLTLLSCASATIIDIDALSMRSASLNTASIVSNHASVSALEVASLSVGTIFGATLGQELSVTAFVSHVSTGNVTCVDLSCSNLHVESITRTIPHISDTDNPAVLTTTSGFGDFAVFSEDATHSGDFVINGSLYVTDTIFMGTESALTIDNVQRLTASAISVAHLEVGMLTGLGGGDLFGNNDNTITDVIGNFLSVSPHDTVHEGNMQIDGNLLVSGVVLTGASNRMLQNTGHFDLLGDLSVAGDLIASGDIVATTVRIGQLEVDMLTGIGAGTLTGNVTEAIANVLSAGGIDDTIHTGNFQIDGNLVVSGAILTGAKNKLLHDVSSYELEGTLSVAGDLVSQTIITSKLRVAELEIDMISGIGFGTAGGPVDDVINNLLSVSATDAICNSNMQIEGNLIVSGTILTGAHNKLEHQANALQIDGALSVSNGLFVGGDITASDGSSIVDRIANAEGAIADLSTSLSTNSITTGDVILGNESLLARLTKIEQDIFHLVVNA
tara:strand:+ start:453 stop:4967 length:4515 start_codon:yes stop_codon:yes gene_type:complete